MTLIGNAVRETLAATSRRTPPFRGKMRVLRAVDSMLRSKQASSRVVCEGATFDVDGADTIEFNLLYTRGGYAGPIVGVLRKLGETRSVYWDIGANIGTVGLPLASLLPELEVVLFEPSPPVLARLTQNVNLNPQLTDRIQVIGLALTDATDDGGFAEFHVGNESENSGVGGLGPSHNRFGKSILVGASTGDELIESGKLPAPDLIKIDVEGFEIEVLTGLERHLRASQNVAVVFEHCLYRFRERQMSLDAPTKYLAELGFSFKVVEESGGLRPLSPGDLQRDLDFVATK